MFDSVKKKQHSCQEQQGSLENSFFLDITRGGISLATVVHADIRGLVTA